MAIGKKNISTNDQAKAELKSLLGVTNLEENQVTGVVTYSTKADLDLVTGTANVSYKVTNDPTASLNGYYTWNGSSYTKESSSYIGKVASGNTDAIVGGKVYDAELASFVEFCRSYDSTLVPKDLAKVGDATPISTLNWAYRAIEDGTIFGISNVKKGDLLTCRNVSNGYTVEALKEYKIDARRINSALNSGTPEIYKTDFYVKSDNSESSYTGAKISKDYEAKEGDVFVYSGKYGLAAVAAIFWDSSGTVISYIENSAAMITVSDLEITAPANTAGCRFCTLASSIFDIFLKSELSDRIETLESDVVVNGTAIQSNADSLDYFNILFTDYTEFQRNEEATANNSITAGALFILTNEFSEDFVIKKITFECGAVSEAGVEKYIYLYAIDYSTKEIKKVFSTLSLIPVEGESFEFNVTYILPAGTRLCVIQDTNLRTTYATGGGTGFVFYSSNYSDKIKEVGDIISETLITLYSKAGSSGLGFSGIEKGNNSAEFASKTFAHNIYGKKFGVLGDSMVAGHSLSFSQTWAAKLGLRNNMTVVNYGINGTLITPDGGGDSMLERYSAMDDDCEYVCVFGGTNDQTSAIPIGLDDDSYANGGTEETFKGALNDLCDGLLTKYPDKKIFFITPYRRNTTIVNYVDAIKAICLKYSIPVFDNYTNGGVCWSNSAQVTALTLGNTNHLNEDGHEYASYKYEAFMNAL